MRAPAYAGTRICWGATTFVQNMAKIALEASAATAQVLRLAACYFDDRRALCEAILALTAVFSSGRRISRSIISIVEAGHHEDTSHSVVSADRAAESGEAPRNREERVARNGVGSDRMRIRMRVTRRVVDRTKVVDAGIRDPGSGVDDAE